jgi:anti-sigma factor RsiW
VSRTLVNEAALHAYLDGLLSEERRADVEAYLEEHRDAVDRVAAYRQQNEALHSLFDSVLDEPIPERLLKPAAKANAPLKSKWPVMRYAAMVAWLALGGVIGLGVSSWRADSNDALAALIQPAVVAHNVYAPEAKRFVEVGAADEPAMVSWMSRRMKVKVTIPKLADAGYEMLGGRLLPGARGPACQIMYQDKQGRRITLYMTRDERKQSLRVAREGELQVAYWMDGTMGYALSGDVDKQQLLQLAQAASRQIQN